MIAFDGMKHKIKPPNGKKRPKNIQILCKQKIAYQFLSNNSKKGEILHIATNSPLGSEFFDTIVQQSLSHFLQNQLFGVKYFLIIN